MVMATQTTQIRNQRIHVYGVQVKSYRVRQRHGVLQTVMAMV